MEHFMVIAKVNGVEYLTNVTADSAYGAEHAVLDLGICGKHDYTVTACMAFDVKAMQFETFRCSAITAVPISFDDLRIVIDNRNAEIQQKDYAEERIMILTRQLEETQKALEHAKKLFEALQ